MHKEVIAFNQTQRGEKQDLRAGDVVRVHRKIIEGSKERIQIFEGMVIVVRGGQSSSPMLTVRKVSNGVGVEIIVPLYAPQVQQIELVKRAKVRRANIGYVRTKPAKKLKLKYTDAANIKEPTKKTHTTKNESTSVVKENPSDDLTKIEGIGPKIAQTLTTAGVATFALLADADADKITEIIADVRGNHIPETWPKQAAMARDGQWDELKVWQDEMDGGKA